MSVLVLITICNIILSLSGFSLTILFIIAKLSNWIDWSWWWILVPVFLPAFYKLRYTERIREEKDDI